MEALNRFYIPGYRLDAQIFNATFSGFRLKFFNE